METFKTITVTVSDPGSGNRYYFDTVLTPNLQFFRQRKYVFNQNDATNNTHQLYFSETKDGLHTIVNGYVVGKIYSNGIKYFLDGHQVHADVYKDNTTFNAATTREVHWQIADDAPQKIYPVCYNHSGMYANGYFNLDPTDETIQIMIDRINESAPTATAIETSNLAKSLNNIESTVSDQATAFTAFNHEKNDAGPEVTWAAREAEFVVWGARHHHSHNGGGGQTYDSMLDVLNQRKYSGYHCYDGVDDAYHAHNWQSMQLYCYGQCMWFYSANNHAHGYSCYANTSNKITELGHSNLNMGIDGAPSHFYNCYNNINRAREGLRTDSWEVRDNRYYVSTEGNQLNMRDRWFSGSQGLPAAASTKIVTGGVGYDICSSYNRKRKEAVIMGKAQQNYYTGYGFGHSYKPEDGWHRPIGIANYGYNEQTPGMQDRCKFIYYHNVPYITGNTNLAQVLNDKDKTTMYANWHFNSHWTGQMRCVLTDDGSVFSAHTHRNNGISCARFYRTKSLRALRYEQIGHQYGNDNQTNIHEISLWSSGVRVIQSRNKRNVVMYSPYYQNGSGSMGWVITRDFNRAQGDVIYNRNTSYGMQIMPFRDGDFYLHGASHWSQTSNYDKGMTCVAHQDGRGWFRRYSVGCHLDGVGNHNTYETAIPIHHDGLNY